MKENELPSFADLGVDVEDLLADDLITKAEEFFNDFIDKHFDEIPVEIIEKITTEAGDFFDEESINIEEFKGSLLAAFAMNDAGEEDPGEYVKSIFGLGA